MSIDSRKTTALTKCSTLSSTICRLPYVYVLYEHSRAINCFTLNRLLLILLRRGPSGGRGRVAPCPCRLGHCCCWATPPPRRDAAACSCSGSSEGRAHPLPPLPVHRRTQSGSTRSSCCSWPKELKLVNGIVVASIINATVTTAVLLPALHPLLRFHAGPGSGERVSGAQRRKDLVLGRVDGLGHVCKHRNFESTFEVNAKRDGRTDRNILCSAPFGSCSQRRAASPPFARSTHTPWRSRRPP